MLLVICPYCNGVGIVTDRCIKNLNDGIDGKSRCTKCKRVFALFNENGKVKTRKDDSYGASKGYCCC